MDVPSMEVNMVCLSEEDEESNQRKEDHLIIDYPKVDEKLVELLHKYQK